MPYVVDLCIGDCQNSIYLWEPESGKWNVDKNPFVGHTASVEDLQVLLCLFKLGSFVSNSIFKNFDFSVGIMSKLKWISLVILLIRIMMCFRTVESFRSRSICFCLC